MRCGAIILYMREKFLFYYLKHNVLFQKIKEDSIFSGFHYLLLKQYNSNPYLPSSKEQQAIIASVLSDFDEHIDNLTKLIEKKKAIRDGALEDLVSGRTRLDGFDREW
jgi:type I restriction enzyme S subunit